MPPEKGENPKVSGRAVSTQLTPGRGNQRWLIIFETARSMLNGIAGRLNNMRLEPRLSLAVEPGDQAGCSVATLADIAFIGACAASKPENCDGCGAVHTVRISTRQPMALIQHPAAVQLAYFGSALAVARSGLDGSGILLVGAVGEAGPLGLRAGAAYTLSFSVDASSPIYTMRHRLSTATLLPEDNFGTAAALSPDVRTLATHHSYQSAV